MNIFSCVAGTANTGFSNCSYSPGLIEGALLVPKGTEFTPTQIQSMLTTITDMLANDTKADRAQVIKTFVGMEDKSSEGVYETTGYGGNRKIRQGKYQWQFEYSKGAMCLHKKISTLDNKQDLFDVIWIDTENNCLLGVKSGDNFKGFALELIDVPNFKMNTGASDSKYYVQFAMQDPREMNLYSAIVEFDESVNLLSELTSLKDMELSVHTAMTSLGVIKLYVKDGCGSANLADTYGAELDTSTLWTATNAATGGSITVTSVTYASATGTINIDLDSADTDYLAGGTCTLTIGAVSDLVTAGIEGYSGTSINVTMG